MLRRCLQNRFLLATELPTHRHSLCLKDIVETLTGDAATLSQLRVDSFEYIWESLWKRAFTQFNLSFYFCTPRGPFVLYGMQYFFNEKLSYGQLRLG